MASLPDARLTDSDMPAVVRGERPQMHYGGIDVRIQGNSFERYSPDHVNAE